jgi:site-specific recombinase XerD
MTEEIEKKQEIKIEALTQLAEIFASASISQSTRKAYESDWHLFWKFCQEHSLQNLPADPDTISLYVTYMAKSGMSVATIQRRTTSISAIHSAAGHDSPVRTDKVRRVVRGIKKILGTAQKKSKALSWSDLKKMVSYCDTSIIGIRDAALLLLGWTSALRRSELVALNIGDLEFVEEGLILNIRRSKTDQEGAGTKIGIPISRDQYCPVFAIQRWITRAKIISSEDPLFKKIGAAGRNLWWREPMGRLSARMIPLIVKRYAKFAGMNPDLYSAHSLRRGLATDAGAIGVPERVISRHTRHRSVAVLRGYIEDGTIWAENPLPAIYSPRSSSSSSLD